MKYYGFYVFFCKDNIFLREDKNGNIVSCSGYHVLICADANGEILIDSFNAAVGFEIPDCSIESIEQFAREMIDYELKEYCRMRDE